MVWRGERCWRRGGGGVCAMAVVVVVAEVRGSRVAEEGRERGPMLLVRACGVDVAVRLKSASWVSKSAVSCPRTVGPGRFARGWRSSRSGRGRGWAGGSWCVSALAKGLGGLLLAVASLSVSADCYALLGDSTGSSWTVFAGRAGVGRRGSAGASAPTDRLETCSLALLHPWYRCV